MPINSPAFLEEVLIELMKTATRSIGFSLANIFVGVCLSATKSQELIFVRWMTHAIFRTEAECDDFLKRFDCLN